MLGLYDAEGILRLTCNDREACVAYAELLDLSSEEYSLLDVPDTQLLSIRPRRKKSPAKNSH